MLDSDAEEFGGHKRVHPGCEYHVEGVGHNGRPYSIMVSDYLDVSNVLQLFFSLVNPHLMFKIPFKEFGKGKI